MMFASAGSTPRASAGSPSVTRFIQRIWSGRRGSGMPKSGPSSITAISLALQLRRYLMNFRMLS